MKKLILTILTILLASTYYLPQANAQGAEEKVKVLIGFKENNVDDVVKQAGGNVKKKYRNLNVVVANIPAKRLDTVKKNNNVNFIEEDIKVHTSGQVQDWGIEKVNAPNVWANGVTGSGVKIGVIDSGISPHEDLAVIGGISVVDYTTSFYDDYGHGTHVAGIIGAKNNNIGTVGIAPDSLIYAIKAIDSKGSGHLSDVVEGIDWAMSQDMDIINMSIGANSDSSSLKMAVDKAYEEGILIVAAAGNDGSKNGKDDSVDYPARYDSVIAVGATTERDKRAEFSSTGAAVEVAAPGSNILSTYINNSYVTMSGTSMASPYVAGQLALLIQENPNLSHTKIRSLLETAVRDIGVKGKDTFFGYGLIQSGNIGYVH